MLEDEQLPGKGLLRERGWGWRRGMEGGVGGLVLNSDRLLFLKHRGLKPIMGTACGPRSPWVFSLVCKESVNR